MRLAIGSDHGGYNLKETLKPYLKELGHEVIDVGTNSPERTDYPLYGVKALRLLLSGEVDRAILICGTGQGMTMVANKFKGVRASLCWDVTTARLAREHNNANVLTLGGRLIGPELAKEITKTWLETEFQGERHKRRIDSFSDLGATEDQIEEVEKRLAP